MRRLLIAALAIVPSGCERAAADAQLAAKVNGTEISLRQLRTASPGNLQQALEKVIDRELLVQKALEAGLERDPQLGESIDAARRQLLAQAYIDKVSASVQKSSREEVHAFYAENPVLFAERRIYRMRELVVSAPAELIDVLRAESARAAGLEQVAAWLKSRNARFSEVVLTQPAEQLPLAYLPQLGRMKSGDMVVFSTPLGASVIQLIHVQEAPLSEQEAAPLIEQFLAGRKRLEVAAAEVRRLREAARIEYAGQFKH
jgi:EpsD family peptidyl-prolyl cis-trans isomerase